MLIWLLQHFSSFLERMELHATGDSVVFLTARVALASIISFLSAILLGPVAIRWLQARFKEEINSDSEKLNQLHADKKSTPTMGGLFVVGAIVIATLFCADLSNRYVQVGLFVTVSFALLGAVDDWIKLSTKQNGLRAKQKFAVQIILSLVAAGLLYGEHVNKQHGLELIWPIGNYAIPLGIGFIVWTTLIVTGSSNAVNLTDGLDGLASGCMIFAGSAFVALTYLAGHRIMADYLSIPFMPGCGELSVILGAMVGSMLGFLWFNCYPAQVFMGDTGALPLGAILGVAAIATRQEVLLAICGGIFVIETLSVIFQVGWFRLTGNRLIACSPLHNHYLFKGQHEIKIVIRFWIGSALLAIISLASLKIR